MKVLKSELYKKILAEGNQKELQNCLNGLSGNVDSVEGVFIIDGKEQTFTLSVLNRTNPSSIG